MSMTRVDLSIILACYNEGPTFEKSIKKIISVLGRIGKKWEIIFVEDKSIDGTKKSIEKFTKETKKSSRRHFDSSQIFGGQVKAIYHKKNYGRGKSVSDGIIKASGEICGYLDVDLEVSADYIPIFVAEVEKGYDMVVGRRFYEGGLRSLTRFIASKTYAFLVKRWLRISFEDTEVGYKFFRRSKILPVVLKTRDSGWFWDTEICARAYFVGLKISQVPVLFVKRTDKKSTVRLLPDTWQYLIKLIQIKSKLPKT